MKYAIAHLSVIPLRSSAADTGEQVSQILFGECFEILEETEKWSYIRLQYDGYQGWVDPKQYREISKDTFEKLDAETPVLTTEPISTLYTGEKPYTLLPMGATLPFWDGTHCMINDQRFTYQGAVTQVRPDLTLPTQEGIIRTAHQYLNTPYQWGGKTPMGIDCSGFTQMVYKLNGHALLRDASQQASQGQEAPLDAAHTGDLAFFKNKKQRITHVGIVLENQKIIHAHGLVRIDTLDDTGIYNADQQRYTHDFEIIKRIIK